MARTFLQHITENVKKFKNITERASGVLHSPCLVYYIPPGSLRGHPKNKWGVFLCTIGPLNGDLVQNHNKNRYNYSNGHSKKRNTQKFVINLNDY